MKHTALHLAVFGVLAGAALAAQAADVQIYGRVDAGFLYEHKKGEDTFTQKAGGRAHNRIGFNVVEDLGNGVKVKAYLENGFISTTANLMTAKCSSIAARFSLCKVHWVKSASAAWARFSPPWRLIPWALSNMIRSGRHTAMLQLDQLSPIRAGRTTQ